MYLFFLIFQIVCCWCGALALPAAAMEPDYEMPVVARFGSDAGEDAYTYRTLLHETTPEKLVFRDTTPDSMYPWEEEGAESVSTADGAGSASAQGATTHAVDAGSSTAMREGDPMTTTGKSPDAMATDAPGGGLEQQRSDVLYKLYTRAHPIKEMLLQGSVEGTDFDVGRATVFVIHGFTGDTDSQSVTLVRDALLWAGDANVVAVDWAPLAAGPHYDRAVNNTHSVAHELAARIASLEAEGLALERVHLVGFSLGAQVAGLTGGAVAAAASGGGRGGGEGGRRIPRITALDPARPGFHDAPPTRRLDASDADHVVVLHTASGLVSFEEPLGHADFYANSGRSPQPACVGQSVHGTHQPHPKLIDPAPVVCSHMMAPRYFAESIYKPQNFRSTRCGSWRDFEAGLCTGEQVAFLGPDTPSSVRGTFFFRTNPSEPYGRGEEVEEVIETSNAEDDANRLDARSPRKHDPNASSTAAHSDSAMAASVASSSPSATLTVTLCFSLLLGVATILSSQRGFFHVFLSA